MKKLIGVLHMFRELSKDNQALVINKAKEITNNQRNNKEENENE